ncbi:transcription factor [Ganoderma sinense ZZ0214-1]|uniref:Transcription factor n=1 Tax=Ganoderma sinense ZZ0214-1 TaxID=1077348 RepID=A0A2G8RM76_9APHY|nr:transcription factor [Ganoderma sinense ZZ0214-1]
MSASPTSSPEPATLDEPIHMDAEPPQQDDQEQEAQTSTDHPKPKKAKASSSELLVREPGKSLLPYSRVQKILKADKDLIMVQREAVFLISRATEEFVAQIAEASQAVASREGRATVQAKDLMSCIRRAEEYVFLEEAIPFLEPKPASIKPGKAKDSKTTKSGSGNQQNPQKPQPQPTMLDHFVQSRKNDTQDSQGEVFENEDGTLSGGGPSELPS